MRRRRDLILIACLLVGLLGCAPTASTREPSDRLTPGGFFDAEKVQRFFADVHNEMGGAAGNPMYASDRFAMRKAAFGERDDSSWLWCGLSMAPGDTAWISRLGSFEVTVKIGDKTHTLRDLGVLVALDPDERSFLDSAYHPLLLTSDLTRGSDPGSSRIPLLIRLPKFEINRSRPVSIRPVPGPWRCTWALNPPPTQ